MDNKFYSTLHNEWRPVEDALVSILATNSNIPLSMWPFKPCQVNLLETPAHPHVPML